MFRAKKLLFDSGLVFVLGLLASVFGYLIRMILSRQLSLEDFGLFYAVFVFVSFFVVFRDFGLSSSLMKLIPQFLVKKQYGRVKSSIKFVFIINIIITLLFVTIFILFSSFLAQNYFKNSAAKPLLIILSVYFVFYAFYLALRAIFVGFQKVKIYSLDLVFINLVVLIGLFIFSKFGVFSPALSYLVAVILGTIIGIILLFNTFDFFKYKSNMLKEHKVELFSYGLPLLLVWVGTIVIGHIDTLMLTYFRTLSEVGIYNIVLPTAMLLVTLGSSFGLVMIPLVSQMWTSKKFGELGQIIRETYQKAFVLIVPICLIFLIFADFILSILFGDLFVLGSGALKILTIGAILFSVGTINNGVLVAIGRPRIVTWIIISAAIINVILNLFLIPIYGIIGAAIATSVAYALIFILSSYYVSKFVKIKIPLNKWFLTFVSGIGFVVLAEILKKYFIMGLWIETFLVLILGGFFYVLLILLFRVIQIGELLVPFKNII
ncbi:flippase [archaeon]|nr:flippase [archaeon]